MELQYKILLIIEIVITILSYPLTLTIAVLNHFIQWIFTRNKVKSIANEVALVTGGAHGLGKELCFLLAKQGCHIAVVDINIEGAEETVKLIKRMHQKVKAKAYKVDISNYDQVLELRQKITADLGITTILVNCAGIMLLSKYPNPDWREVKRMIDINLTSHFWTLDVFLPKMKELKKGHIVAISSASGCFPLIYSSQYSATKFGIRGLMKSLRQELIADNLKDIHATTVYPYFLSTNPIIANGYSRSAYKDRYGLIDGADAAKAIVDGILHNELEIMLPSIMSLLYRLYELYPTWWQDRLIRFKFSAIKPDLMIDNGKKDN